MFFLFVEAGLFGGAHAVAAFSLDEGQVCLVESLWPCAELGWDHVLINVLLLDDRLFGHVPADGAFGSEPVDEGILGGVVLFYKGAIIKFRVGFISYSSIQPIDSLCFVLVKNNLL